MPWKLLFSHLKMLVITAWAFNGTYFHVQGRFGIVTVPQIPSIFHWNKYQHGCGYLKNFTPFQMIIQQA
eukprot:9813921-Ditylum_brightwellii.AAC.1